MPKKTKKRANYRYKGKVELQPPTSKGYRGKVYTDMFGRKIGSKDRNQVNLQSTKQVANEDGTLTRTYYDYDGNVIDSKTTESAGASQKAARDAGYTGDPVVAGKEYREVQKNKAIFDAADKDKAKRAAAEAAAASAAEAAGTDTGVGNGSAGVGIAPIQGKTRFPRPDPHPYPFPDRDVRGPRPHTTLPKKEGQYDRDPGPRIANGRPKQPTEVELREMAQAAKAAYESRGQRIPEPPRRRPTRPKGLTAAQKDALRASGFAKSGGKVKKKAGGKIKKRAGGTVGKAYTSQQNKKYGGGIYPKVGNTGG